jgi:hypothetical protein
LRHRFAAAELLRLRAQHDTAFARRFTTTPRQSQV